MELNYLECTTRSSNNINFVLITDGNTSIHRIRPMVSYPSSPSHLHKSTAPEQYTLGVNAYKHNNDVEHEVGMYA